MMQSGSRFVLGVLVATTLASAAASPAGEQGAIAGAFTVNNALPEGAALEAVVLDAVSGRPVANQAVSPQGTELPYRFQGLGAGTYKVRLVAKRVRGEMPLGETGSVELAAAAMSKERVEAPAIRSDGKLAGTVKVAGAFPPKRMVFVSARRTDMKHKSFMPDELNSASFELSADDVKGGQVAYRFQNLSYGVYKVQLTGYDFETHKTQAFGELPGEVVIDLDHREHPARDFEADFGKAPAGS
jgi:hypothetical protein